MTTTTRELPSLIDPVQTSLIRLEYGFEGESRSSCFTPRALLAVPPLNGLLQKDQIACVAAVVHHVRQQIQARKGELPQKMWINFGLPGKIIDGSKIEQLAKHHQK